MLKESFFVEGKFPDFNQMIKLSKSHYLAYSSMKKKWTKKVAEAAIEAKITPGDSIYLKLEWHEPTKRRDPDNIASAIKFVLDGLVTAGVIPNDGWKQVLGWDNKLVHSKKQGVYITLVIDSCILP